MKTGLLSPSYILCHENRTTVSILYSLSWKQDYCPHPIFSVMKTGLLSPSYILRHENRTTVPILYFPSWKQDYCPHPIFSVMKTGLLFPSYILCHENRTLKKSTVIFYALLRNVSHAKTEKTEFNNCLSVCCGMSVFACINTCVHTCISNASLTHVFFSLFFFPQKIFHGTFTKKLR